MGRAGDGEKPVKWLTDFDEAAEIAEERKRPMLLLFTTRALMDRSRSCTFAANRLRRRVRESKVVPVRLLPPVMLETKGLPPDEVKKRKELYAKAKKRYAELVKQYAINRGPSLLFCAADTKNLSTLLVPNDDQIENGFDRLYELVAAYEKAQAKKKDGARKPGDAKKQGAPKDPAKNAGKDPGGDKPAEEKKPENPDEDF
jgi:hypothetical protein